MKIVILLIVFLLDVAAGAQTLTEWKLRTDDGVNLYVAEFGKGDTVLVLHGGWGAEYSYLANAFAPLANSFHFVFYDQRGSLRSQCADSLISVPAHIEDVERLRKTLGMEKLTIAAHSMGSFLALSYFEKYPANVKKLLLMGSIPAMGTIADLTEKIAEPTLKRWERPMVKKMLRKNGLDTFMKNSYSPQQRWLWHRITFAAINLYHAERWASLAGSLFYSNSAGIAAIKTMPEQWNFIPLLQKNNIPVLILHGTDDYVPIQYHRNLRDQISNTQFVEIKNAGHCLWIDEPRTFKKAVKKFLRSR